MENIKNNTPLLLEMLNDYEQKYHGKMVDFTTGYKPLKHVSIPFHNNNFPHLIGLHKVNNLSAKKQISQIKNEVITYNSIRNHDSFNEIKDRIIYFDFIDKVFINEEVKECIHVSKIDKNNRMKLDVVFLEENSEKIFTLGFRQDYRNKHLFFPTTFYVNRGKKEYTRSKRAKIRTLTWK